MNKNLDENRGFYIYWIQELDRIRRYPNPFLQQKRENKLYFVLTHRVIFSFRKVILKPCGFSDILFEKTAEGNTTYRKTNIAAK